MEKNEQTGEIEIGGPKGLLPKRHAHPSDWSGVLAQQGYVLGIDISGAGERVVMSDLNGTVIGRDAYAGADETGQRPRDVLDRVVGMMRGLLDGQGVRAREILRIGVGFGGPVDAGRGVVRLSHQAPGWEDFPLAAQLEGAFDVPTLLDNDARLAALGEVWFGAGAGNTECNLVYVHWSTGVGGGLVANGRLVRGENTVAGEIGHLAVPHAGEGLPCRCGGRGHLEAYVRASALVERALALYDRQAVTDEARPLSVGAIFDASERDPKLKALVDEAIEMMSFTVGNLITALNPKMVVIGGRVARECSRCIPRISDLALATAMPLSGREVRIVDARLGEDSGVMGAVALGLDSLR